MKELSIEEKAKLYDKALERAKIKRDEYIRLDGPKSHVPQDIEFIFPELAESEDERIKKDIVTYLTQSARSATLKVNAQKFNKWIAWLEKQGEQKSEEVDNLHNYLYGEQKPAWSEEDKENISMLIDLVESKEESMEVKIELSAWLKSLKEKMQAQPMK